MPIKRLRKGSRAAALALCLVVVTLPVSAQTQKPDVRAPYLDPALPVARRVADLVSRMTLEEKVAQMMNAAPAIPRLGIPEYDWWNEALHGVAFSGTADAATTSYVEGRFTVVGAPTDMKR